jgi:zona occludens toxin
MIHYITGTPGSGKTYLAMYILYGNFGLDEKIRKKLKLPFKYAHAKRAYTNIAKVKYDHFDNVNKLVWKNFYAKLKEIYEVAIQYDDPEESEDLILKEVEKHDLQDTLFILDESHNYLDKEDKVLIWWFTYHRHLHHEILLLTQNLTLVKPKYKATTETYFKAVSTTFKLLNDMKYKKYSKPSFALNAEIPPPLKLKLVQEIFDTYTSGASNKKDYFLAKIVGAIIILFVLLVLFINYGFNLGERKDEEAVAPTAAGVQSQLSNLQQVNNNRQIKPKQKKTDLTNKLHKIAYCSKSKKLCIFNNNYYSYKMFYHYLRETDSKVFTNHIPQTAFYKLDLVLPNDFFLLKGASDENELTKDINSNSGLGGIGFFN